MEVDGVHESRFPGLPERAPIHVQWSPDGARLGILAQHVDQLELWVAEASADLTAPRLVAEGSPLYFSWLDHGERVVLHVGDPSGSRIEVRDVVGDDDDRVFRLDPGSFCAPVSLRVSSPDQERVAYVVPRGDESQLITTDVLGEDALGVGVLEGLVAVVGEPCGDRLAFSAAPDAGGSPYDGVWVVPADGRSAPERVIDEPVLAFFWRPSRDSLVWCRWDTARRQIIWKTQGADGVREVARSRPTRDMRFQLRFFEQYAASHPLVSPDGRYLVWAGHDGRSGLLAPRVFVADLDHPERAPEVVAEGSYGVFPASRAVASAPPPRARRPPHGRVSDPLSSPVRTQEPPR